MVLRDLRYVIFFVEDLERSLEFYVRKVGLEVRHRAEGYAELAVDGPKLALLERWRVREIVSGPISIWCSPRAPDTHWTSGSSCDATSKSL